MGPTRRLGVTALVALLMSATFAIPAVAVITGTDPAAVKIAAPASVWPGALESNTQMFVFDEKQNVTLAADLPVDITGPGLYDDSSDLTGGVIPAGTRVNSHFVHTDAVGVCVDPIIEGTVYMDSNILGIIVSPSKLIASDHLGAPTAYIAWDRRALELDIQVDRVEQLTATSVKVKSDVECKDLDQVRIITVAERLGTEGCTPGYWKQVQHFDSWVGYAPGDSFEAVFGRDAFTGSPTLLEVLDMNGAGLAALGRHSVAGLLSAQSGGVDYPYTSAEVIATFQAVFDSGDAVVIEDWKDELDAANNLGCGLS